MNRGPRHQGHGFPQVCAPSAPPRVVEAQALEGSPLTQAALAASLMSPLPAVRLHDSISEEGFHYLVFDL